MKKDIARYLDQVGPQRLPLLRGILIASILMAVSPQGGKALPMKGTARIQPIDIEHWLDSAAPAEARIRRDIQCAKQVFSQIGIQIVDGPIATHNDPRFFKRLTDQPFNV